MKYNETKDLTKYFPSKEEYCGGPPLFTCGGTAGHINPALGVAGRIRELIPDAEILFVGAEGKMETELIPREGYALKTIRIEGVRRSVSPKMIVGRSRTRSASSGISGRTWPWERAGMSVFPFSWRRRPWASRRRCMSRTPFPGLRRGSWKSA